MSKPQKNKPAVTVEPQDGHNQRLVGHVHPADWTNPEPSERYHLVVIGGGTAGLVSAAGAAGLGAKVALIESHLMGGDCLNFGCVPSKAVIRAARAWHDARHGSRFGAPVAEGEGDFAAVMERMRKLRADISKHDSAERFRGLGVDVYLGEGRFVAEDAIEVGGQRLDFRRAVVATGGKPFVPPIPGLQELQPLTNESIFSLTECPRRLVVIGAGPIGCELAQSFARLGSEVHLIDMAPQILPREDDDAAKVVQAALEREGVVLHLGAKVEKAEKGGGKLVHLDRDGRKTLVEGDEILVAVGRKPNVDGLGLEAAGIDHDRRGVTVDDHLRTTNKRVFACGDVASAFQFTHTADAQARIVLRNALFPLGRAKNSDLVIPWCTYTSPEIAHVGLYAGEAEEKGYGVETITIPLADCDRAILDGETEGFLRIHLKKGSDRILGATFVAEHAGESISELTLAITAEIGLEKLASTIHPYPTQAEAIKKAADTFMRGKLTSTTKTVLDKYFDFTE
jgi:pyruvate/2-oxoglutarate dehydrogenase complex dihydrolipoamide dehydrogenase (E3) component